MRRPVRPGSFSVVAKPARSEILSLPARQYFRTISVTPLYHCWPPILPANSVLYTMPSEGVTEMEGAYSGWMGQPVVLRVVAGEVRVPLRGRLVGETAEVVRVRVADSWDVDIFKSMILGIEADRPVCVVAQRE